MTRIPRGLKEHHTTPTISTISALRMINDGLIQTERDERFETEFKRVNDQYYDGRLNAKVVTAFLPNIRHLAFYDINGKTIVINTGRGTDEERLAALKHEMVHAQGINGHGLLFQIYAERIGAPVAELEGGKLISAEEQREITIERIVAKDKLYDEAHPASGQRLMRDGKPVARVFGWVTVRNGKENFTMPRGSVWSIEQVPMSATQVQLVYFDSGSKKPIWNSRGELVPREKLQEVSLSG